MSGTYYDPALDNSARVYPSIYPAHIIELKVEEKVIAKNNLGKADVHNFKVRIAPQAAQMSVQDAELDSTGAYDLTKKKTEKMSLAKFVGREVNSSAFFLFYDQPGKNKRFQELCLTLGVKLDKIEVNGKTFDELRKIYPSEVTGIPVMVKVENEYYDDKKTGEKKSVQKVVEFLVWEKGVKIDLEAEKKAAAQANGIPEDEDDLPF